MLWSSEAWSASGEIRNIIFSFEANSCKIYNHNLIAHSFGFAAQDVVDFDVSIGYVIFMKVFYSMAGLQENNASNVTDIIGAILSTYVGNYLRISFIAVV